MSTLQSIRDAVAALEVDDAKFVAGNSAAGTRARKSLQEIGKLIKVRRNEITEEKNLRKDAK